MSKIILFLALSGFAFTAHAVQDCANPGRVVGRAFYKCIEDNFRSFQKARNIQLLLCQNPGSELTHEYAMCVQANFNTLRANTSTNVGVCLQAGENTNMVEYSNCIRKNFDQIAAKIRMSETQRPSDQNSNFNGQGRRRSNFNAR